MACADALGLDFGTSNSAVGALVDGAPRLVAVEPGAQTLPTSVFFDFEARRTVFGSRANAALIAGEDGRFMRALKSVLGTPLMHEPRRMMGETLTLVDVVARFLGHLKGAAEAEFGRPFERVISGRPVRFHSADAARNDRALDDLRACYAAAGFTEVRFLHEPEAAAIAAARRGTGGGWKLIVDIGGGTSDFTLYRHRPKGGGIEIAASHGVRLGGTDFDRQLSVDHVMPLLGQGGALRDAFGTGVMEAPKALFRELATWQLIPFLYTPEVLRRVVQMEQQAVDPVPFARLHAVLEDRLGHDIAFAVERAKIAVNDGDRAAQIDLSVIERALSVPLSEAALAASLARLISDMETALQDTLHRADVGAEAVETVVFVGGSSLLSPVQAAVRARLPGAAFEVADVFTAIVDGLTLAAGRWDG